MCEGKSFHPRLYYDAPEEMRYGSNRAGKFPQAARRSRVRLPGAHRKSTMNLADRGLSLYPFSMSFFLQKQEENTCIKHL